MMKKYPLPVIGSLLLLSAFKPATAGEVTPVYGDASGVGFNDTSTVAAVTGNTATTLGGQRKAAFEAALAFWGTTLNNTAPIRAQAIFSSDNSVIGCTATGATLAFAGTTSSVSNIPSVNFSSNVKELPKTDTIYPVALARELTGRTDIGATGKDYEIESTFNGRIGQAGCLTGTNWFYGFGAGATTPANHTSFYETAVHELAHGLGFSTGVGSDGRKNIVSYNPGTGAVQLFLDDVFMLNLKDLATGKKWSDAAMTNTERAASYISVDKLVWDGAKVTEKSTILAAGKSGNEVKMYAPNPVESGSSVSHFDKSLTPNEIMEPAATATNIDTLTKALMCDIGWKGGDCSTTTTANGSVSITGTAQVDQTLTAVVADADGFGTVTYQWLANGAAINGATASTYVVKQSDLGKKITVKATYSDNSNNAESPTSSETLAVTAAPNKEGSVTISGTAQVGQTLTAAVSDTDGTAGVTITYQWLANTANISGATSATYQLTANELSKTITVKATYTDQRNNQESPTSAATAAVTAATTVTGDADGNGVLDVNDVIATLKQVFSGQTKTSGADYDGNGTVDVNDLVAMLKKIFTPAS